MQDHNQFSLRDINHKTEIDMLIFFMATLACLLLSCSANRNFKTVKYPTDIKGHKLILKIPKGYSSTHTLWEGLDDGFKYKDSSIIYVTSESNGGVNYNNIEVAGLKSKLFYAFLEKDTLILDGIDKNGLYWKNYLLGGYNIGYKNVKKERKDEFDKVISNAHVE